MSPVKVHHARIMVECGCAVEDVAVTLGLRFTEALYAVAPALKANAEELKRVRRIVAGMKIPPPAFPAIHDPDRSVDVRTIKRRAA